MDGNFVSNRKDKNGDPNDFPLSKGAAYFVHEDDVMRYLPKLGALKIEVSRSLSALAHFGLADMVFSTQLATSLARWVTRAIGARFLEWCS